MTVDELIAKGESPRMAEILASRTAPGLNTGSLRANGDYGTNSRTLRDALRKNGADPNGVYHTGLARYMGDPKAVCRDQADVEKRKREMSRDGAPVKVDVAQDIVDRLTDKEIAIDPKKGGKKRRETAEAVKNRLKGNFA